MSTISKIVRIPKEFDFNGRWDVVAKDDGYVFDSFSTRAEAEEYKRNLERNTMLNAFRNI